MPPRRTLVTAAAVAALALPAAAAEQTIPADSPLLRWMGRVRKPGDGTVHFDWLGVGVRVAWSGAWLRANYAVGNLAMSSPFKVAADEFVEGYYVPVSQAWVSPAAARAGNGTAGVVVAVGGSGDALVSLNSPPQYFAGAAEAGHDAVLVSLTTDGQFAQAAPFVRSIEFVGDSITAGTNILSHPPCADGGFQCSYQASWAGILAANFSANASTIAVGGKGLIRNCCDNGLRMPDYFRQVEFSSPGPDYTFAATGFTPDAVVINLGTNDFSGATPTPAFQQQFTDAYVAFMQNITAWYDAPHIEFFCAVGPMTAAPGNATAAAVAAANAAGLHATLLNLTGIFCDGCAGHPGVAGHRAMAAAAQPVIASVMGWA